MRFRANSWLLNWNRLSLYRIGIWRTTVCSAVILGPKWSNIKFVYLLQSSAIKYIGHVGLHIGPRNEWRCRLYIAQEPLDSALVLSNLREYRHKWYSAKTRFFGLHLCRRQCNVMGPKATEFGEITQNKGRCAAQGHSFPSLVTDFSIS